MAKATRSSVLPSNPKGGLLPSQQAKKSKAPSRDYDVSAEINPNLLPADQKGPGMDEFNRSIDRFRIRELFQLSTEAGVKDFTFGGATSGLNSADKVLAHIAEQSKTKNYAKVYEDLFDIGVQSLNKAFSTIKPDKNPFGLETAQTLVAQRGEEYKRAILAKTENPKPPPTTEDKIPGTDLPTPPANTPELADPLIREEYKQQVENQEERKNTREKFLSGGKKAKRQLSFTGVGGRRFLLGYDQAS